MTQQIRITNFENGGPYTIKVTETRYKEVSVNRLKPGESADYYIYDGCTLKIEEE